MGVASPRSSWPPPLGVLIERGKVEILPALRTPATRRAECPALCCDLTRRHPGPKLRHAPEAAGGGHWQPVSAPTGERRPSPIFDRWLAQAVADLPDLEIEGSFQMAK